MLDLRKVLNRDVRNGSDRVRVQSGNITMSIQCQKKDNACESSVRCVNSNYRSRNITEAFRWLNTMKKVLTVQIETEVIREK
jgi:hypothetical protein